MSTQIEGGGKKGRESGRVEKSVCERARERERK
jgi:hypothetical protein